MSKIKKADLLQLMQEQADMIADLSGIVEMNKLSIIKLENELEQSKLKKLTQSVFDGLDAKWRFAAVDGDGSAYAFMRKPEIDENDPCFVDIDANKYRWIGENYDTTNWQDSLIERKELTGSDLCRKILERGDKYVLCFVSDFSDDHAVNQSKMINLVTHAKGNSIFAKSARWKYAVPINQQTGELLTASEVGL